MSVRTSLGLAGSQAARAHFLGSTRHWFCKGLYREKTGEENTPWSLADGLLLYQSRLVIPTEEDPTLRTRLLDEIHKQASTAHPGRNKTRELVRQRYYWQTWRSDMFGTVPSAAAPPTLRIRFQDFCNLSPFRRDHGSTFQWISILFQKISKGTMRRW